MQIKNCRFLKYFNINAIVLYPFVLYCDREPSRTILSHERIHFDQIRKEGVVKFYCRYLLEYIQGRRMGLNHDEAYRNISFEKEAYQKQDELFS